MAVIYIASPYTLGDVAANVAVQMDAAHRIMDMGHTPLAPLLSHFLHIHRQRPYTDWTTMDLALLGRCDVVLRLPGESKGADAEEEYARSKGIPVAQGWDVLEEILL